jgi:type I restriction enzyme, S subunit
MSLTERPNVRWSPIRLRFVCDFSPSQRRPIRFDPSTEVTFLPMEAIGEDGSLDLSRTRRLADVQAGYTYFEDEDVILAKITPCFENGKGALCAGLHNGIGYGTTELHVLRAGPSMLPRFLYYLTRTDKLKKLGEAAMYGAGGQKRVPERFLKDYIIGLPPS